MKKTAVLIMLLFMGLSVLGQEFQEGVLILKDGTTMSGTVEKLPDGGARITNAYGDIFEYSRDEISYAGKEMSGKALKKHQKKSYVRDYSAKDKGYKFFVETGLGGYATKFYYSKDDTVLPSVMLHIVNGYSFSQYCYLGVGLGISTFGLLDFSYIPVYAHIRSSFLKKKYSPFISVSAGCAIDVFSIYEPYETTGLYLDCGVGLCVKRKRKGEFWLSANGGTVTMGHIGAALKVGWSF